MGCSGEEVHGHGFFGLIAQGGEAAQIPGQGGGVAGDVHNAFGGHGRHRLHHVGGQSLSGRVHTDHVGPHPLRRQLAGRFSGVAAEEPGIENAIPFGILFCVLNGLGHHFRADDRPGLTGHGEADGTDAAVEVQHCLTAEELGKLGRLAVENFGLVGVDLVEGGHRQPEGQAAQGIHQEVLPPQGAVSVAQNDIILLLVDSQHHPHQTGFRLAEVLHQLRFMGHALPVDQQAEEGLPFPVGTHIDVADQTGSAPLVIGGDMAVLHPVPGGGAQPCGALALEQAVVHVDDLMGPRPVKAHLRPL